MTVWKVKYYTRHGAQYSDICTTWNKVLMIKRMHSIVELNEVKL